MAVMSEQPVRQAGFIPLAPEPRRRRWLPRLRPTFSLRTLLILVTLVACYVGYENTPRRKAQRAADKATALGISVNFSLDKACITSAHIDCPSAAQLQVLPELPGLEDLNVSSFASPGECWDKLAGCTRLSRITIYKLWDYRGLARLAALRLPRLEQVAVCHSTLTRSDVDKLRAAGLPLKIVRESGKPIY